MRKVLQEIHGNPGKSESILGFLVHILMYATVCCVFFLHIFLRISTSEVGRLGWGGNGCQLGRCIPEAMAVLCLRCEVAKIECVGIVGMADVCKCLCNILQRSLHFLRHWKFGFALSTWGAWLWARCHPLPTSWTWESPHAAFHVRKNGNE